MKWSGSKDSQANEIIKYIDDIENYYEPFCGGGSIFISLLETKNIKNYFISDLNPDLINVYLLIKNNPSKLIDDYETHYNNFNVEDNLFENRKKYFTEIRSKYNKYKDASDFYWIMRTTTNGMPRYSKNKGEFNNSCHFTRPGMEPKKVKNIIEKYSLLFNEKNVNFNCCSYDEIEYNGLIYLDPPYEGTKGMYYSKFNNEEFIVWLDNNKNKWILSYDGKVNNEKMEHKAPNYKNHIYLKSGNSSFRRVIGNSNDSVVSESLYMNF